ncbi:pirin family protein [Emticicia sp. C21]|uniref:pirin family protein n=1 Tax=Emticicia sp. C21 TaxID=2302915 RepID=UPI000E3486C5|nr:pirin-like C-terminal cupin domain-containing protein [Emticicia sp. C21]RFS17314.1 pirin family protein [Emticicia sp. C21]
MKQRIIEHITTPQGHQGFLGEGHTAKALIDGKDFANTDPFILLMDDALNLPGGKPVGGPHPHAGFETVTLVLQGDNRDWHTGSLELMTAGKGIIHTEEIASKTHMHILQLWLALPPEKRWIEPSWQQILLEDVPTLKTDQAEIRIYSGSIHNLHSPLQNHTPFTLVDFTLGKNTETRQEIPAEYNGFIYVLEGEVTVGKSKVTQGQVAWLDRSNEAGESELTFIAGEQGTRFVLYAGKPHKAPIVSYGPFIADMNKDIIRLYNEYHAGQMPHLNNLPESRKTWHRKVEAFI